MVRRYSSYKNISNFVENVGKNWRNSIYVTCSVCKNEKQHCCDDILVSFNSMGVPTCVTVTDANYIYATIIDKSECLLEMSNARFLCLFEEVIRRFTKPERGCPLLQMTKISPFNL